MKLIAAQFLFRIKASISDCVSGSETEKVLLLICREAVCSDSKISSISFPNLDEFPANQELNYRFAGILKVLASVKYAGFFDL